MTPRLLLYVVALLVPLGGALIAFFTVRKFKHERDEAKKALKKLTADQLSGRMRKANERTGSLYLPGSTQGSMQVTDVHVDWSHMAKAFEAQAAQSGTDEVYVLSPDELHQLSADIKLHRDTHPNTSFEAKENSDGLVTLRVGGVTYHVAKELFGLVEEFWCNNKGSSRNWHR